MEYTLIEKTFYSKDDVKKVSITFLEHIDITPKFINAKKNILYAKEKILPITTINILFYQNKLQGEKNETGTKRLKALLKWMKNQNIKKSNDRFYDYSNISEEDFLKLL